MKISDTLSGKKILKIVRVAPKILNIKGYEVGEVFLHENNLAVQSGQGALSILKLQFEGGKILETDSFLRGNKQIIGSILK